MGRTPKPTALKILEGNPGKRPLNKSEPKPSVLLANATPPNFLKLSNGAKRVWQEVLPALPKGLITNADQCLFARWCELQIDRGELREFIRENGRTLSLFDSQGNLRTVKTQPQIAILSACEVEIRQIESQIGMTPSSRSRVQCAPVDCEVDVLERELFGDL
jgi:P27 family predicted phage terminase small subunit